MDINAGLVLDIWELMVEQLPSNRREDVANKLVRIFADKGLDADEFDTIKGEDHYLDAAIDSFFEGDRDNDDEFDYESNDYDDS